MQSFLSCPQVFTIRGDREGVLAGELKNVILDDVTFPLKHREDFVVSVEEP